MSTTTTNISSADAAFIVRTPAAEEEFTNSADAIARYNELVTQGGRVDYLEREYENPEADDEDRGDLTTDLIRSAGTPDRYIALPEAALHVVLDALRNYRIDVEEMDGFEPWKNYDSERDEDQLANPAGTSMLISDAAAAVTAALDARPGEEPAASSRLHVTDEALDSLRSAVDEAREAAADDSNDGEIESLQGALDEALTIIGLEERPTVDPFANEEDEPDEVDPSDERPAGGREHVLTVRVLLDSDDAAKVTHFKTEAGMLVASQLRDAFVGDAEGLDGYEGATIAAGPFISLSSF
ncbi:hypothetical protein GCM10025867_50200 (plasmid) [Frondihabitans sucicola]|uniref:Uncharacterized protein n=1 Tax=Frondihabitans sucicola TaxID=1268041 RepID=A0ABM8GWC0_9MICO|nr:hypothetical protein [Frondihabitans sucicola]BDZ52779.1 hypothetical protein GCM10025867_50200 [Frondihabitans sucicola]